MTINLEKRINLVKKKIEDKQFTGDLEVALVLDVSGSMNSIFRSGLAQDVIERILAVGVNLDKDKVIQSYVFSDGVKRIEDINLENYSNYAQKEVYNKGFVGGGTNYAPAMKAAAEGIVNKKKEKFKIGSLFSKKKTETVAETTRNGNPLLVFFVTDGDNWDSHQAEQTLIDLSGENVFFQFVGISENENTSFSFLEKLDNLSGRVRDNANFFNSKNTSAISDEALYDELLKEFPTWYDLVK